MTGGGGWRVTGGRLARKKIGLADALVNGVELQGEKVLVVETSLGAIEVAFDGIEARDEWCIRFRKSVTDQEPRRGGGIREVTRDATMLEVQNSEILRRVSRERRQTQEHSRRMQEQMRWDNEREQAELERKRRESLRQEFHRELDRVFLDSRIVGFEVSDGSLRITCEGEGGIRKTIEFDFVGETYEADLIINGVSLNGF